MPLTAKGNEIMESMKETYGSPKKAKEVFYASKNAGTISGVDAVDDSYAPVTEKSLADLNSENRERWSTAGAQDAENIVHPHSPVRAAVSGNRAALHSRGSDEVVPEWRMDKADDALMVHDPHGFQVTGDVGGDDSDEVSPDLVKKMNAPPPVKKKLPPDTLLPPGV